MGIIILYNRVYECLSTMYTDYSNNYDTSHVAYPEGQTFEEMQAEWAIFAALQPPLEDITSITTHHNTSLQLIYILTTLSIFPHTSSPPKSLQLPQVQNPTPLQFCPHQSSRSKSQQFRRKDMAQWIHMILYNKCSNRSSRH